MKRNRLWMLAMMLASISALLTESVFAQRADAGANSVVGTAQVRIPLLHKLVKSKPLLPYRGFAADGRRNGPAKSASKFTLCAFNTVNYGTTLYNLPTDGSDPVAMDGNFSAIFQMQSAAWINGYYYLHHVYGPELTGDGTWYIYDIMFDDDGWLNSVGEDMLTAGNFATAQTVDPTNSKIYAISPADGGYRLFTMSYDGSDWAWTVNTTDIGVLPGEWNAIAINADGMLYGTKITRDDTGVTGSSLCSIDKSTAAVTVIGATGEKPYKSDGAVIDPNTNTFYWLVQEKQYAPTRLVKLDLATGASTTVKTYDDNADMFPTALFAMVEPDPSTPNRPTDISVTFEGKTLSGTLSFKAPDSNLDGGKGDGLTYKITFGETTLTGTCAYSEVVNVPVTVPAEGMYQFGVKVINGEVESGTETVSAYAGRAVPPAVAPVLTYDEDSETFTVTWNEPDLRYVQGYLDKENLSYTVRRYPGEVVVAEKTKDLSFSESTADFPENFTRYYYTVEVFNEEIPSLVANYTEAYALGYLIPPFTEDFNDSRRSITGYTIIDGNNDGNTWKLGNSNLAIFNPSSTTNNNDWFITPSAYLERGKTYFISIEASISNGASGKEELISLDAATAPTAAALSSGKNLGRWTVTGGSDSPTVLKASFAPQADGFYYFGFFCYTRRDEGGHILSIDNFEFSTGVADNAPAAPVVSVSRQVNGELRADVTVKAPAKDISDNTLTSLTQIDVMRDGELVKTFTNPVPGEDLTFTDDVDAPGNYSWKAVAYNEAGAGKICDAFEAFVGQDIAAAPENFRVVETEYGKMHASWDRVTTDRNGNEIDPSRLTYTINDLYWSGEIKRDMTGTELDFDGLKRHDPQQWKQYSLYAVSESGIEKDRCALSDPMIVGEPQNEYVDKLELGASDHYPAVTLWCESLEGNAYWTNTGALQPGIFAKTGIGFLYMIGESVGASSSLTSPRVRLSAQENPAFSCWVYNDNNDIDENTNEIDIEVLVEGTDKWIPVAHKVVNELAASHQWGRLTVSLEDFADKTVQIRIIGTVKKYIYTIIDDIAIKSIAPADMSVDRLDVPDFVKPGEKFTASVKITNHGAKVADSYTLTLDVNGESYAAEVGPLATGETACHEFEIEMPGYDEPKALTLNAAVKIDGDADTDNNSASAIVDPLLTRLPAPENLTGSQNEAGRVDISWTVPTAVYHTEAEEKFNDGEAFAFSSNYNDWIFIDRDGKTGISYFGRPIPNYTPGVTTSSFFVFDGSEFEEIFGYMINGTDDKYFLCSLSSDDFEETDDWAITPELDGSAQTVTFKVRGLFNYLPPEFDVLYSIGSTDPDDFVELPGMTGLKPVPAYWSTVCARLPEGAKRMAIRSRIKNSRTMLHIDDVRYFSAGTQKVSPESYNVYRDNSKAGDCLASQLFWNDTDAANGSHEYRVTAVYPSLGESAPTRGLILETAGVSASMGHEVTVSTYKQSIVVSGCGGREVRIYDAMGRTVYSGTATDPCVVTVAPGIYLVDADGHVFKLFVK